MAEALFGAIDQVGHVVGDLDAAIAARLVLGLGPWTVYRNTELQGAHRGTPTRVLIDVGLAYQGGVQIELIQLRSATPSPYAGASGLHHLAWLVDDLDRAVGDAEARGLTVAFTAHNDAVRVAYLESAAEPGAYYELIEGQGMREMMDMGIAQAGAWEGSDPIAEIDLGGAA